MKKISLTRLLGAAIAALFVLTAAHAAAAGHVVRPLNEARGCCGDNDCVWVDTWTNCKTDGDCKANPNTPYSKCCFRCA